MIITALLLAVGAAVALILTLVSAVAAEQTTPCEPSRVAATF
jgi:uncharacterized membrane protein YhiD involved in acid resistance